MLPIRQILCAIDFSEPSYRALDYAVTVGRACHARVVALVMARGQVAGAVVRDEITGREVEVHELAQPGDRHAHR